MNPVKKASKGKMVKMRADELKIHPLAQREIVPSKLKSLAANLDLDAVGVVHAVQYSIRGKFGTWVVDGQHRIRALIERDCGEWEVDVKLHLDVTDDAGASALFLMLNDRSPVTPFDKFVNEVRAGAPDALGVESIAKKHGVKVARQSGDGKVTCVIALKQIFRIDDGETLDRTFGIDIAAWGTTASALEGRVLAGLATVVGKYNGALDHAALTKKLATYHGGAPALIGHARGLMEHRKTTLSRCVAEIIIGTYNKGRRSGKLDAL